MNLPIIIHGYVPLRGFTVLWLSLQCQARLASNTKL